MIIPLICCRLLHCQTIIYQFILDFSIRSMILVENVSLLGMKICMNNIDKTLDLTLD